MIVRIRFGRSRTLRDCLATVETPSWRRALWRKVCALPCPVAHTATLAIQQSAAATRFTLDRERTA
jgi:hypothetical protein